MTRILSSEFHSSRRDRGWMLLLNAQFSRLSSQRLAVMMIYAVRTSSARYLSIDFFAVRTMTEVAILTCSRTEDKRAFVQQCITLPLPSTATAKAKYIADTAFNSSGSQIATVTDKGFWTIYDLSVQAKQSSLVASRSLELPELSAGERRTGWWKIEWIEQSNNLLVAESKGLHLLNLNVPPEIDLN